MWQVNAANEMNKCLCTLYNIKNVALKGSMLDISSLDIYSDVDMDIYLADDIGINIDALMKKLSNDINSLFGYEIHNHSNSMILRICFFNGWKFDLTFIYPQPIETQTADSTFDEKIERVVNQFWFLSFDVLLKLGRNDYLVAAHLALELCQLNIVIQMLMRDYIKNTSIHRFGDKEDVPILHTFPQLKSKCAEADNKIASMITFLLFQAAEQMDSVSESLGIKYQNRFSRLKEFQKHFNIYSCN